MVRWRKCGSSANCVNWYWEREDSFSVWAFIAKKFCGRKINWLAPKCPGECLFLQSNSFPIFLFPPNEFSMANVSNNMGNFHSIMPPFPTRVINQFIRNFPLFFSWNTFVILAGNALFFQFPHSPSFFHCILFGLLMIYRKINRLAPTSKIETHTMWL